MEQLNHASAGVCEFRIRVAPARDALIAQSQTPRRWDPPRPKTCLEPFGATSTRCTTAGVYWYDHADTSWMSEPRSSARGMATRIRLPETSPVAGYCMK